jgi:predicted alpha/beta superfamily hydrolase
LSWKNYLEGRGAHTITGELRILENVYSPQLENRRDILVHLPPSYSRGDRAYRVLYMHDGQNLFDSHTSFSGEWGVDETLHRLAGEGKEAIVVGIPNLGEQRVYEYNPMEHPQLGVGRGDSYLAFITETVKPIIDRDFRTLPDRMHTGIAGSSMGGLISLYGFFRCAHVFGLAGVFSPSLWVGGGRLMDYLIQQPFYGGRIYLDMGGKEFSARWAQYVYHATRQVRDILVSKGYQPGNNLLYLEDDEGGHNEGSWAHRLPGALRFLL